MSLHTGQTYSTKHNIHSKCQTGSSQLDRVVWGFPMEWLNDAVSLIRPIAGYLTVCLFLHLKVFH